MAEYNFKSHICIALKGTYLGGNICVLCRYSYIYNNNNNTTKEIFRKVQNSRLSFLGHAFKGSTLSN